jgi:YD repeat-containing protein
MRILTICYIIYISCALLLLTPILGWSEMALGDALFKEKIENWPKVENHAQDVDQVNRLVRNFSLKEEFSRSGRLIGRERIDGTREKISYDQKGRRISVWVTSSDGKFQEERLYLDNRLRAILYVDQSLKTLQYLAPMELDNRSTDKPNKRVPALSVVVSAGNKVRILQYNAYGQLICGYRPGGKKILQQSQTRSNDLDFVIPIDDLKLIKQ